MRNIGVCSSELKVGDIVVCIKKHDGRYLGISKDYFEIGEKFQISAVSSFGWSMDFFITDKEYRTKHRKRKLNKILYDKTK